TWQTCISTMPIIFTSVTGIMNEPASNWRWRRPACQTTQHSGGSPHFFTAAVGLDPRDANPILDLAYTLYVVRKFGAAAEAYDKLIAIVPDEPAYKIEKELNVTFMQTGDEDGLRKVINQTPTAAAPDRGAISQNLSLALYDRDWPRAKQLVEQLQKGGGEAKPE